jgi:hypothetical protein
MSFGVMLNGEELLSELRVSSCGLTHVIYNPFVLPPLVSSFVDIADLIQAKKNDQVLIAGLRNN